MATGRIECLGGVLRGLRTPPEMGPTGMNDQEQDRCVEEEPASDEEIATGYEPPAIVVLGRVDQLTAFNGSNGGMTQVDPPSLDL